MAYTFQTMEFNGTSLRLVPHEPDNGYRLFVSFDGAIGLRIAPNGIETLQNAIPTTCENCKIRSNAKRKQRYLQFKHPWNTDEQILVSHAVYLAWSGKPIPPGHQIHHLNGITTDNCFDNLLCVPAREHRSIADARQTALKTVVPDGDLRLFTYERLRELQDPQILSDEQFAAELEALRKDRFRRDPRSTDDIMLSEE